MLINKGSKEKFKILVLVLDVDGTLTDGKIYMGRSGELFKSFDIKDGLGIHDLLPKVGIVPVIITGRNSEIVSQRCSELGIKQLYQGIDNKLVCLKKILSEYECTPSQVSYIGDDLNDLECMKWIKESGGVTACPIDAVDEIKKNCDFVSSKKGGDGAVREFIEWLKIKMKILTCRKE